MIPKLNISQNEMDKLVLFSDIGTESVIYKQPNNNQELFKIYRTPQKIDYYEQLNHLYSLKNQIQHTDFAHAAIFRDDYFIGSAIKRYDTQPFIKISALLRQDPNQAFKVFCQLFQNNQELMNYYLYYTDYGFSNIMFDENGNVQILDTAGNAIKIGIRQSKKLEQKVLAQLWDLMIFIMDTRYPAYLDKSKDKKRKVKHLRAIEMKPEFIDLYENNSLTTEVLIDVANYARRKYYG